MYSCNIRNEQHYCTGSQQDELLAIRRFKSVLDLEALKAFNKHEGSTNPQLKTGSTNPYLNIGSTNPCLNNENSTNPQLKTVESTNPEPSHITPFNTVVEEEHTLNISHQNSTYFSSTNPPSFSENLPNRSASSDTPLLNTVNILR